MANLAPPETILVTLPSGERVIFEWPDSKTINVYLEAGRRLIDTLTFAKPIQSPRFGLERKKWREKYCYAQEHLATA